MNSVESAILQKPLDRLAIALSGLCALHCLATPVALLLIPALAATHVAGESFHRILLIFVLPASALALLLGCWRHKDKIVLGIGILGLTLLVFGAFAGHELLGEIGEKVATMIGTTTLAMGHARNYRLCRHDGCEHPRSAMEL